MKNLLNNKYYIVIWSVIVGLFNAVLFLTTNGSHYELSSFWIAYGFIMFAFVFQLVTHVLLRNTNESQGIEIPSTMVSLYLIVVVAFGSILLGLSKVIGNKWLVPFIILLVVTAIFIIAFVFGLMNKEHIKNNPQKIQVVFDFAGFIQLLYDLLDKVDNPQVRSQISKILELAEDTSSLNSDKPRFKDVEKQIFEYAYFLSKNVERNEIQNIYNNINKLEKLLLERKKIAM